MLGVRGWPWWYLMASSANCRRKPATACCSPAESSGAARSKAMALPASGPQGYCAPGRPGHEVLGLLHQVRADLRAAGAVLGHRIDDGRGHGIAAVGILLDLFEKPGPPRLGLELHAELVQLPGIDEQIGMLRRRVQNAGAAECEQDAEHLRSSIAQCVSNGTIAGPPWERDFDNLRNMVPSFASCCSLRRQTTVDMSSCRSQRLSFEESAQSRGQGSSAVRGSR